MPFILTEFHQNRSVNAKVTTLIVITFLLLTADY